MKLVFCNIFISLLGLTYQFQMIIFSECYIWV